MNAILKERIGERVSALKISWRRASLEAGLEAGFIQDLITGRSQHPSEDAVTSLATVLKCSSAYLTGRATIWLAQRGLTARLQFLQARPSGPMP